MILSETDVNLLFGFSRSYFHADLPTVGATVSFIRSLLPKKRVNEIYTMLGRAKQGKTERYRHFFKHLRQADELFTRAEGEKGMVMIVFTLPSYDLVFKVIRDRFAYPKNMLRAEVMEKYQLVFRHDRAGRLVDAQEYRGMQFPRAQFEPDLLDELLVDATGTCRITDDQLLVDHCYVERRMTPLNLFLEREPEDAGCAAIIEYGQAIRDLALSNIFPGDLFAEELWCHPARPRYLLRLRRTLPRDRLQFPGHAGRQRSR